MQNVFPIDLATQKQVEDESQEEKRPALYCVAHNWLLLVKCEVYDQM